MEAIIAVAIELENHDRRFFITWGRIQDVVDPEPIEQLILRHSVRFGLGGKPVKAQLCKTLQAAAQQPYFYEHYFSMCQRPIPFGDRYGAWKKEMGRRMQLGKELYYTGSPDH